MASRSLQVCLFFLLLISARSDDVLGCYHFGFAYSSMLTLPGNPFNATDAGTCQRRCASVVECENFAFFPSKRCFLGSTGDLRSAQPGAVAGPKSCSPVSQACMGYPEPGFPGATSAQTSAAWPGGEQPTPLQCWPRGHDGFPMRCLNKTATILEDTQTGWSGRCEGLKQISDLQAGETCQIRCLMAPLCSVWIEESTTDPSGGSRCWNGMLGDKCNQPAGGNGLVPTRGQRIAHGTFRVLANIAGMQIKGLVQTFDSTVYMDWQEGAKHCKFECRSFLLCQFWQYSKTYGCYIDDPRQGRGNVGYPLVTGGTDPSVINSGNTDWVAGEMIQHNCVGAKSAIPTASPLEGSVQAKVPGLEDAEREEEQPWWVSFLIFFAICLCISVIGAAIWMGYNDKQKKKKVGRVKGGQGSNPQGSNLQQSSSSYSQQEDAALLQVSPPAPQGMMPNFGMPFPGRRQMQQMMHPQGPNGHVAELNAAAHRGSHGGRFF